MRILYIIVLLFIASPFSPSQALAASDGLNAISSTGMSAISLTIPKLIYARSFSDFTISSYSGIGDLNLNDDLNISTNYGTAARTYQVSATGSGAGSAFTITNGTTTIAYNAYYNQTTGTSGRVAMTSGTALTGRTSAVKPLSTTTLNANLSLEFLATNLQVVDAGTYTGSITLVFTPE